MASTTAEPHGAVPKGRMELTHYQKTVLQRYRAVSTLPLETVWSVILNSIETDWDPIARSASIAKMMNQPLKRDDGRPHVTTSRTTPLIEDHDSVRLTKASEGNWETYRRCEVTYRAPADPGEPRLVARTAQSVKIENGKTVYVLEESIDGDAVAAALIKRTGTTDGWKRMLENAVRCMGDAVMERSVFVLSTQRRRH